MLKSPRGDCFDGAVLGMGGLSDQVAATATARKAEKAAAHG
jgi:hypothetical protein